MSSQPLGKTAFPHHIYNAATQSFIRRLSHVVIHVLFYLLYPHLRHTQKRDSLRWEISSHTTTTQQHGIHTCNRALHCFENSVVIALLHVAEIYHRITRYKGSETLADSPAQTHVYQPMARYPVDC